MTLDDEIKAHAKLVAKDVTPARQQDHKHGRHPLPKRPRRPRLPRHIQVHVKSIEQPWRKPCLIFGIDPFLLFDFTNFIKI